MNKNNLKPLERIQKHLAAHQTKVTDLATSVHQLRLGAVLDTAQTLEQFNADVVEAGYFYEMYWLHPERGFDE
jgi:hypothetical protein